jgi:hypothetical protein
MQDKEETAVSNVELPAIANTSTTALEQITQALGVPRTILASDEEIARAWAQLPRLLGLIPAELRDELHVRMCVAVDTGLFDSAINYAWNSAVLALRNKARAFGLTVVSQVIQKPFDEAALLDLKDSELLDLSLSLNLLADDAYFFLSQCRDIRNNFSAAHPTIGNIDDAEFVAFLNRIARYALSTTSNPRGVDTRVLIEAIKGVRFNDAQHREWVERLAATHEAQRDIIISMLHGIYCDPSSSEETRLNSIALCESLIPQLSPHSNSELLNRHSDYVAQGKVDRQKASLSFFERLGMLGLLSDVEHHAIISGACKQVFTVHQGWDNFHNEPPFASRLLQLSEQFAIPDSAQAEFVSTVVTCASGNPYGTSTAAYPSYATMARRFSPREVSIMLDLPDGKTLLAQRMRQHAAVAKRYRALVALIDEKSVPRSHQRLYERWH